MNKDIHIYVETCLQCHKHKPEFLKPKGLLGNVPTPSSVFETVHIHFIVPYPRSSRGNKFCLVVEDQLSAWPEIIPMSRATSTKVVEALEQVFARFGAAKRHLNDNASTF